MYQVDVQVFNADGSAASTPLTIVPNLPNGVIHIEPEIAALEGGEFAVTWVEVTNADSQGTKQRSVLSQVFNSDGTIKVDSNGTPLAPNLVTIQTIATDIKSEITSLDDGNYIITWTEYNRTSLGYRAHVEAAIYDSDGQVVKSAFLLNGDVLDSRVSPAIVGLEDGRFIAIWRGGAPQGQSGDGDGMWARIFNNDGTVGTDQNGVVIAEFLINSIETGVQTINDIRPLNNGGFVVTWTSNDDLQDSDGNGVKVRFFDSDGQPQGVDPVSEDTTLMIEITDLLANDTGDGLSVSSVDGLSELGAAVTLNTDDGSIIYDPTSSVSIQALGDGQDVVDTFTYEITDSLGNTSQADVSIKVNGANEINLIAIDDYFQTHLNAGAVSLGDNLLQWPAGATSATLSDGRILTAWSDVPPEPASGIYPHSLKARILNADGTDSVTEFFADPNGVVAGIGSISAFALGTGGYGITWVELIGTSNSYNLKMKLFAADGSITKDSFITNTHPLNRGYESATTELSGGRIVVTWHELVFEDPGNGQVYDYDIFAKIFNADGTAALDEFGVEIPQIEVNTYGVRYQFNPEVTALENGEFAISWTTQNSPTDVNQRNISSQFFATDGSQKMAADGSVLGEIAVNEKDYFQQTASDLVTLNNGNALAVWQSYAIDDVTSNTISARIFDSYGDEIVSEFTVNELSTNGNGVPLASALANGRLVVVWGAYNVSDSGQPYTVIKGRIFNENGTIATDLAGNPIHEFTIIDDPDFNYTASSVTATKDGGFFVTWDGKEIGAVHGIYEAAQGHFFDKDGNEGIVNINDEDNEIIINEASLLQNDNVYDGSSLSISDVDLTSENGAALNLDVVSGEITYDPLLSPALQALAQGDTVVDTFDYTIENSNGETDTATVSIEITGVNDAPTLAADTGATDDITSIDINLATLGDDIDSDNDGSNLSYSVVSAPDDGTFTITGQTLSFDPGNAYQYIPVGETLDITVSIMATDAHGATAINDITITITGLDNRDKVKGNSADNSLSGGLDNDQIKGYAGDDILKGGEGDDQLYGHVWGADGDAADIDTAVYDGNYSDYLFSSEIYSHVNRVGDVERITVVDSFDGGFDGVDEGRDIMQNIDLLQFADQTVAVGSLQLSILGTLSSETLSGNSSDNHIYGFSGDDQLKGKVGNDFLRGGGGNDQLFGNTWGNRGDVADIDTAVYLGNISDYIFASYDYPDPANSGSFIKRYIVVDSSDGGADGINEGTDLLLDIDQLQFADGVISIDALPHTQGTSVNDNINGTSYDDHIDGLAGNDQIKGYDGNDVLAGGQGDDKLFGNIWGDSGSPSDTDTVIYDGNLADYSISSYIYTLRPAGNIERIVIEDDTSGGTDGVDEGRDELQDIDVIEFADQTLNVGAMRFGTDAADTIVGDGNDNFIVGKLGADAMSGGAGAGADTFHFTDLNDSIATDLDTISDFAQGEDLISLFELDVAFTDLLVTDDGTNTQVSINGTGFQLELDGVITLVDGDFIF